MVAQLAAVPLSLLRLLVPPLASSRYKGQAGKVGVLGGCLEYTGAPFYAAISALKLGADLSHIFCDEQAAVPIKSYSPELIVHGCLRAGSPPAEHDAQAAEVIKWFPALTALVIGPGLGRDPSLQAVAARVIEKAVQAEVPCVIDADGLRVVLDHPELVRGSRWVVLTPNRPEYERMLGSLLPTQPTPSPQGEARTEDDSSTVGSSTVGSSTVGSGGSMDEQSAAIDQLARLCNALDGPVVVRKGPNDWICNGAAFVENCEKGSPKRSGGQGDVLAGTVATLLSWARAAELAGALPDGSPSAPLLATYTGCLLTRRFSREAFARHRRAMTAPDLVEVIGHVFEEFSPSSS